jgi:anti-anti-sigma factor
MQTATYQQVGNTLMVSGTLDWPLDIEFDLHTKRFIDNMKRAEQSDLRIDVTGVDFMGSQYLGAIASIAAVVKAMGGSLTVTATGRVGQTLQQVGLERVMALELT